MGTCARAEWCDDPKCVSRGCQAEAAIRYLKSIALVIAEDVNIPKFQLPEGKHNWIDDTFTVIILRGTKK